MHDNELIRRTTRVLRRLYCREKQWLESRTAEQISLLTQQGELLLSEQLHYGEIAFVLLGLKPCAIIDYAGDREQLKDYITAAIQPTLRELNELGQITKQPAVPHTDSNGNKYPRPFRLACSRINGELASPEVPSWTGAYVLYDEMWEESAAWVRDSLLNEEKHAIAEDELAHGLDYPGSLPKSVQDMHSIVPVSYLGRMKNESGEWMCDRWETLTSFIVLHHELPQAAHHRMRYQAVRLFDIEMQVTMDTSLVDEFPMN
ncbi:hypothetical protein GGI12_003064 [Dipsacomyces acuminosporus]|nr:hypothetical protein GGI12_003064 [Dipsacomyces acuminosporus]